MTDVQGGRPALTLWAASATRNGPLWGPLFGSEWGLLGILEWAPKMGSFFHGLIPFGRSKKHESLKTRKSYKTSHGSTENAWCPKHVFLGICFLLRARFTLQKCFFVEMDLPHVYIKFPSICGTLQTKNGPRETQWAPGDTVSIFGETYNAKTAPGPT